MNIKRVLTLARRVMRQIVRDRRLIALLILMPMLVLYIGSLLFRADSSALPLGVVNLDEGFTVPFIGEINLGQLVMDELQGDESSLEVFELRQDEVDERLRDGTVQGVAVFPEDFTSTFIEDGQAVFTLRLEGSNPTRSRAITGQVTGAAMRSLAGLAGSGMGGPGAGRAGTDGALPVEVQTDYLYGGEEFDMMDFFAPVYIALLAMFFVFLLSCVAFLRERSQGTLERLMATPATRLETVLGYMLGLGLIAAIQVSVILFFTVWVLGIHYAGSLWLLMLIIILLALVGVNLGILASAFARTEFQVVQFIPLLIIPQVLLAGTIWPVSDMPEYLQPIAYVLPLYYGNRALSDVMLKGWGLLEIWPSLATLAGMAVGLAVVSALMMRREVA